MRAATLLLFLAVFALRPAAAEVPGRPLELSSRLVKLNVEDLNQERAGRLVWRGGIELVSPDPAFGGLSGLWLAPDARRAVMVSDEGRWVAVSLAYDEGGHLVGAGDARIGALLDAAGRDLGGDKVAGDAEALLVLPDGSALVSFERVHRIARYSGLPPAGEPIDELPIPAGHAPKANEGLEGLARLPDGRLLALSEGLTAERAGATVWQGAVTVGPGLPASAADWRAFHLPQDADLAPVEAAIGPEGVWLYWLERGWSPIGGIRVKLKRAPVAALQPGALLQPEELAYLVAPLTADNYEALWLRRGPAGETLVTILSDDNFQDVQRTLLLQFELAD